MVKGMTKKQKKTIKKSFKILLQYEFIYLVIASLIVTPPIAYLYNIFINKQVISLLTILAVAFLFVFILFAVVFNKISIIIITNKLNNNKKLCLKEIVSLSISKFLYFFSFKNIISFILYIIFIPFFYFAIFDYIVIYTLKIYNFSLSNILSIIIVYTIIILVLFRYIYFLNYMIIDDKNRKKSLKASAKLIKKYLSKDISNLLGIHLIMVPAPLLIILLYKLFLTNNLLNNATVFYRFSYSLFWIICILILSIYVVLINVNINFMFYNHRLIKKEKTKKIKVSKINNLLIVSKFCKEVFIVFSILLCSYSLYQENNEVEEEPFKTEVTAHRGASIDYPENTMAAFKGAKMEDADWIEIDVRKTKDNKYVVFHDDTLDRITGVYGTVSDMNLVDLRRLDCGSFFDEEFADEKMPILEDVIKYAKKNNLKIILDLKNNWEDIDFYEKDIIDMINKYDFADYCIIETPLYKQIRNIKRIDSNIKTAFLGIPMDELYEFDDMDAVTIDIDNISSYLIKKAHDNNKQIFVWGADEEEQIRQMVFLEVDNIITNNVQIAKEIVNEKEG